MPRNQGFEYRQQAGPEAHGRALADYLAQRYPHSSGATWRRRIEAGEVLVDGRTALPDGSLVRGQLIVWRRPGWDEPDVAGDVGVLFEDTDLLAVRKPAGLPTLPGAGFLQSTLLHRVRQLVPEATPVHRLGRWTSGVVMCGRTPTACADLSRQLAGRLVRKRYRALATGSPGSDSWVITTPIGPIRHPLLGSIHAASPGGKPATSRVRVLERRDGAFLCDVEIESGRPHQIRIHLAAAGHPLLGDPLYGPGGVPPEGCRALPGDPGYSLHATQLDLQHPRTRQHLRVTCSPPTALRRRKRRPSV